MLFGAIFLPGMETDDLEALAAHMKAKGVPFRKEITDFGFWKYVMAPAPDNVLLELFQIVKEKLPKGDLKNLEKLSLR